MMEEMLCGLLREQPGNPSAYAAKYFSSRAVAEERKPWAVHLTLCTADATEQALKQLAEFHAEQWGCLRQFIGRAELPPGEAGAQGFDLRPRPWRCVVYAVYATPAKLRGIAADDLADAVAGLGSPAEVEEHWLEYCVGAGRRDICGELLWVVGLDAPPPRAPSLPGHWAVALPYVSSVKGWGFARLYTRMPAPLPNGGRGGGGLAAVNLTSWDTVDDWQACTAAAAHAMAFARTADVPRVPGLFRVTRYH